MRTEIMAVVFFKHSQRALKHSCLDLALCDRPLPAEMKEVEERRSCVCRFGRVEGTVPHILQGGKSAAPFDRCLLNLLWHKETVHL